MDFSEVLDFDIQGLFLEYSIDQMQRKNHCHNKIANFSDLSWFLIGSHCQSPVHGHPNKICSIRVISII